MNPQSNRDHGGTGTIGTQPYPQHPKKLVSAKNGRNGYRDLPVRGKRFLVTGVPRSGTTWAGMVIASNPNTFYLHEPFNPNYPSPYTTLRMKLWYQRLANTQDEKSLRQLEDLMAFRFRRCSVQLRDFRYFRALLSRLRASSIGGIAPPNYQHVVMKDPIALLSADIICERLGVIPVFLVRDPVACVSSLVIRNWRTDFDDFYVQRNSLARVLPSNEIDRIQILATRPNHDLIENACQLWRILNLASLAYLDKHPDWITVRHEDLLSDPVNRFAKLFGELGLEWQECSEQFVRNTISDNRKTGDSGIRQVSDVRRNPGQLKTVAQERLSPAQIDQVRRTTADVFERLEARSNRS